VAIADPDAPPTVASALDLDPDLATGIPPEELEKARGACRGALIRVSRGRCQIPMANPSGHGVWGFIVIEGLICRELSIRDNSMLEFLGPTDVLQPPMVRDGLAAGARVAITASTDAQLLAVGSALLRAAARWPSILAVVLQRLEAQRERLAFQGLIAHLPRAEHRLLLALAHLSERWGRVTPDGILVPLPLTHSLLGQMIGARRPTVTLAVRSLQNDGVIRRSDNRFWLLTDKAPDALDLIVQGHAPGPAYGETIVIQQHSRELHETASALRAEAQQLMKKKRAPFS
jgi:CRP-like cAMP-binding protein